MTSTNHPELQKAFAAAPRPHILMITNHGVHQWQVIPGLPDTGGQNVFVNQFSQALAEQGFKITIVNRGGYPHPRSGTLRRGVDYKDSHQRILLLEDDDPRFIRKEEMNAQLPTLAEDLKARLSAGEADIDMIISHYWDGARLGALFNRSRAGRASHIWVPHSLGSIKKSNVSPDRWGDLRIDERIAVERELVEQVDAIAATSTAIRRALMEDYGYQAEPLFLPPCVDPARYHPRRLDEDDPIWPFLETHCGLSVAEIRAAKTITEISRTDTTKRKDVLIRAFARIQEQHPGTFLVVTIDESNPGLAGELKALIRSLGVERRVAVLGSVWEELPRIYAATDIYCTPSVMEGFGMSAQEAAATGVPVVASDLVPFVNEYLLGDAVKSDQGLRLGDGAIIAPADDVDAFTRALDILLSDEALRSEMGQRAYEITIPRFTWEQVVSEFLESQEF
jgi:mannosylfructose-phosphate synthase